MTKRSRPTHGGSAASGGFSYQDRCAAWCCVHILAEELGAPRWDLPTTTRLRFVCCETSEPVDDILLGTSEDGYIFLQAKHTLNLSQDTDSPLASALDECVRQYLQYETVLPDQKLWQKKPVADRDRLVIITSRSSAATVREDLSKVLKRLRTLLAEQPLSAAAVNQDQTQALTVLLKHVRIAWEAAVKLQPTDDELRVFFTMLYIDILDVDEGKEEEYHAIELLQRAVLADPDHGPLTWTHLLTICKQMGIDQGCVDLAELHKILGKQPILLRGTPNFRDDIKILQHHSTDNLAILATHRHLQIGTQRIEIMRDVSPILLQHCDNSILAIVGDPGAGKTGVLLDIIRQFSELKRDTVVITAEDLLPLLLGRQGSRLEHPLYEVLKNWPGENPAYLCIDALDTIRSNPQYRQIANELRLLIEKAPRWHVLISVRLFDLAHSTSLRDLFAGKLTDIPQEFCVAELSELRHIFVPLLSERELHTLQQQSSLLSSIITQSSPALQALLRNPFNLNLAATLAGTGEMPKFSTAVTQLDLLDRYWERRVLDLDDELGTSSFTRERVLRILCEQCVSKRSLTSDWYTLLSKLEGGEDERALKVLLQQHLLLRYQGFTNESIDPHSQSRSEPTTLPQLNSFMEGNILTFDHLILFDYAVSRLILRGFSTSQLSERLTNDPDLLTTIAPSLTMHFQYLWTRTRTAFWETQLSLMGQPDVPVVGRVYGIMVPVAMSTSIDELEILLQALDASEEVRRNAAEECYRHLVDALEVSDRPLVGKDAGPWSALAERVAMAPSLRVQTAFPSLSLISILCKFPDQLLPVQFEALGHAARNLLAFAQHQSTQQSWLTLRAIECVCRTCVSDPLSSQELLRFHISQVRLATFGYEEIPQIARDIEWLITPMPDFVAELYLAAFSYEESSQDPTFMLPSRIMGLISNRKQDYESGLYSLKTAFPQFIRQHPHQGTSTCLLIINQEVRSKHQVKTQSHPFAFRQRTAFLCQDDSYIWDSGEYETDSLTLVRSLMDFLGVLSDEPTKHDLVNDLLDRIAAESQVAVIWRRLLQTGQTFPQKLGTSLNELLVAEPILSAVETSYEVGELLKVVFSLLKIGQREQIEDTLLHLGDEIGLSDQEFVTSLKNQLLGCLPEQAVSAETKQLLADLRTNQLLPPNLPLFQVRTGAMWTQDENTVEDEIDLSQSERDLIALTKEVNTTRDQWGRTAPTLAEGKMIYSTLQQLKELLIQKSIPLDPESSMRGWSALLQTCERIAYIEDIVSFIELGIFAREELLRASTNLLPAMRNSDQISAADADSWSDRDFRVIAAHGLIGIAQHPDFYNEALKQVVQQLAQDQVMSVRSRIAHHLVALQRVDSTLMWELFDAFISQENQPGVLNWLVLGSMSHLANIDPERIESSAIIITDRFPKTPETKSLQKNCAGIFFHLALFANRPNSLARIIALLREPERHAEELGWILFHLRRLVSYQKDGEQKVRGDEIRKSAHDLFFEVCSAVINQWKKLLEERTTRPDEEWATERNEDLKTLGGLLRDASAELYFGSGAHAQQESKRQLASNPQTIHLTPDEQQRFFQEMRDIFVLIAEVGEAGTAHCLIQTLSSLMSCDPEECLTLIAQTIDRAKNSGYAFEGDAVRLMVEIVEKYIADYRPMLREQENQRRLLLSILDAFVHVGWPQARRLIYRLDTIFR
ncbi:MAG: hypothetical protein H0V70_08855 [Ktedonobacteraceae bacterium]|nr:hypothetical protein [Ktedonobacteraceae bacterium]